jgi:hypothetical protein
MACLNGCLGSIGASAIRVLRQCSWARVEERFIRTIIIMRQRLNGRMPQENDELEIEIIAVGE